MTDTDTSASSEPLVSVRHGAPSTISCGQTVVHVTPANYLSVIGELKAEGFEMAVDLCAVDFLAHNDRDLPAGHESQRFEVVVNLLSMSQRSRIRVRCQVPAENPIVPSLFGLYPSTEAMEREAFDMVGVRFSDHPDLTRILMPEDWEGHPLRKDYATGRVPVQFKAPPETR